MTRWWERYRAGGLDALLQRPIRPGRPSRMTTAALARVQTAMEQGEIATIEQARHYVATHDQIAYQSQHGMAKVLRKHHIKKKTGRRRHRKASAEAQQAFKKTSPAWQPDMIWWWPSMKDGLAVKRGADGAGVRRACDRPGSWKMPTNGNGSMSPWTR